jgi:hypothetical protein
VYLDDVRDCMSWESDTREVASCEMVYERMDPSRIYCISENLPFMIASENIWIRRDS